jgi:putative addiction module component (TIGR02574 family)
MSRPALDINAMTPDERLDLIGELWDSLEGDVLELSNEQRTELQRRMADVDAEGPTGTPWSEVKAKLLERIR